MPNTGLDVFDSTLQKTSLFLKEIEEEFGWQDRRFQSYAAARTVLHALRDRMTVQEAADFAGQLPILLKGVFFDGWSAANVPRKMDADEFREEIQSQFQYSVDGNINDVIRSVVRALGRFISKGEMEDVASILPKNLANLIKEPAGAKR